MFYKKFRLKRIQLFEFSDLKWWPDILRNMTTDFLHAIIEKNKPYLPKLDLIVEAIKSTQTNKIVDVCSGSLGPWLHLEKHIKENYKKLDITFTDIHPNHTLAKQINSLDNFCYSLEPIDARDIPPSLDGTRTLFNGFHHFAPNDAQKIFDSAIANKKPIIIFEILNRYWKDIFIVMLFMPFYVLLLTPFFMKLSFKNIFFTYIFPIFPIVFTWDSIISNMRCYSEEEIIKMIQKADKDNNYQWYIGQYRHNHFPVLYCIAYPK